MANRIKGITVEIGGDTTRLTDALRIVNKEVYNTQAQLQNVEKLLKLDPSNTELLAQKQRLLNGEVLDTKGNLEALKSAYEQANEEAGQGMISEELYEVRQFWMELWRSIEDFVVATRKVVEELSVSLAGMFGSDFVGCILQGIEKSRGMIAKAVDGVASDMVIQPRMEAMEIAGGGSVSVGSSAEMLSGITGAITDALSRMNGQGTGDIVIPVYLGGNLLDEVIVDAQQRMNLRSGGR